jgi:hypothetical protein
MGNCAGWIKHPLPGLLLQTAYASILESFQLFFGRKDVRLCLEGFDLKISVGGNARKSL